MAEVKLLVLVCNWCSYGGADQAGQLRLSYPTGVRLVRVMCSGRVDAEMILEAFCRGADGVLVLGCHPGDCHYKQGNHLAQKRAALLARILAQYGVEPERFRLDWVSAKEGERFREVVTRMHDQVAALGPLHLQRTGPEEEAA
jgi:F420-non-reducing hydrogenase iron-sulfur subunit